MKVLVNHVRKFHPKLNIALVVERKSLLLLVKKEKIVLIQFQFVNQNARNSFHADVINVV